MNVERSVAKQTEAALRARGCTCAVRVAVKVGDDGLCDIKAAHESTCALVLRAAAPWN